MKLPEFIRRPRKHYTSVLVVCSVRVSQIHRIEFIDNADMGQDEITKAALEMAQAKHGASFLFEVLEIEYQPATIR